MTIAPLNQKKVLLPNENETVGSDKKYSEKFHLSPLKQNTFNSENRTNLPFIVDWQMNLGQQMPIQMKFFFSDQEVIPVQK